MADVEVRVLFRITAEDVETLIDRQPTSEELASIEKALPHSSIPEALAVVVASICEHAREPLLDGEAALARATARGVGWGPEEQEAAQAEGWDVFENDEEGRVPFEICRIDFPSDHGLPFDEPKFESDEAVVEALVERAGNGDVLARKALDFVALVNTGTPYSRG
jgi:hypothetical protein